MCPLGQSNREGGEASLGQGSAEHAGGCIIGDARDCLIQPPGAFSIQVHLHETLDGMDVPSQTRFGLPVHIFMGNAHIRPVHWIPRHFELALLIKLSSLVRQNFALGSNNPRARRHANPEMLQATSAAQTISSNLTHRPQTSHKISLISRILARVPD